MYKDMFLKFFQETGFGSLQPLSINCGPHLVATWRQVNILHLMQLTPLFQQLVGNHAQCVIQFNLVVSALRRPCSEHTIVLDSNNDTQIIMKIGVHLMRVPEMRIFMEREGAIQDVQDCRFPRSGQMRHTMTGDHWAVLRPLMDAIEVPAVTIRQFTNSRSRITCRTIRGFTRFANSKSRSRRRVTSNVSS